MKRRILFIAFAFTLILSLSLFAGCGEITEGPNGNSTPSASSSSSSSSSSSYEDSSSSSSSSSSTGSSSDSSSGQETCDHVFGDYEIITPATCIAEGEKKRTCSKCGEVQTEKIQNSEHSYGEWVTDEEPDCETAGSKHRTCTTPNCGAQETETISALGHDGNPCTRCQLKFSEGLEFAALSADGESYGVSGIGTCTDQHVVIPSTYDSKPVTSILNSAFSGCDFTKVTIPSSVTFIDCGAFTGCRGLTEITIPDSVTSIGDKAEFLECTSLKKVTIGNGLTSIGANMFAGCAALTEVTIGSSVTSINTGAFQNCSSLTSITIPNSVTSIGSEAFQWCEKLTDIHIGSGLTSVGSSAFSGISNTRNVYITDIAAWCGINFGVDSMESTMGANPLEDPYVENGGSNLYLNNQLVTTLEVPSSVKKIGDYAFRAYKKLTSVTIPASVESISKQAFSSCEGLTSVTINGAKEIGDQAFWGCTNLTALTLGEGITKIGYGSFQGCYNLTSLTLPKSITQIGSRAFDATQIKEITFAGTIAEWGFVSRSEWWAPYVENGVVLHCSDGDLTIYDL